MLALDLATALPETVLAVFLLAAFAFAVLTRGDTLTGPIIGATTGVMGALGLWIAFLPAANRSAFGGMLVDDAFARYTKVLILWTAGVVLPMAQAHLRRTGQHRYPFPILAGFAVLAMLLTVSAGDLVALFLAVASLAAALTGLATLGRRTPRATALTLRFTLGLMAGLGLIAFGIAILVAATGATGYSALRATLAVTDGGLAATVGLVLLMAGLAVFAGAAPFHIWCADMQAGAPGSLAIVLAALPRVTALAALARLGVETQGPAQGDGPLILVLIGGGSLLWAAFAAAGEPHLRRLIAHAAVFGTGLAVLGMAAALATGTAAGMQAALLVLTMQAITLTAALALLTGLEQDGRPVTAVVQLRGFGQADPLRAAALSVLILNLAGLPPLAGVVGVGFTLGALSAAWPWAAAVGAAVLVPFAAGMLRVIFALYTPTDADPPDSTMPALSYAALLGGAAVMLLGLVTTWGTVERAARAAQALWQ